MSYWKGKGKNQKKQQVFPLFKSTGLALDSCCLTQQAASVFPSDPAAAVATLPATGVAAGEGHGDSGLAGCSPQLCVLGLLFVSVAIATRGRTAAAAAAAVGTVHRERKNKTKQRIWKWKRLLDVRRLSGFSAESKHFFLRRLLQSFSSWGAAPLRVGDFCLQLKAFSFLGLCLVIFLLVYYKSVFIKKNKSCSFHCSRGKLH